MRYMGVEWSPHPSDEEARREYDRIWSQLGSREIEDAYRSACIERPIIVATLDILTKPSVPAQATDNNLVVLVSCRAVNLSLERGNCDASCFAYVLAGSHRRRTVWRLPGGFPLRAARI